MHVCRVSQAEAFVDQITRTVFNFIDDQSDVLAQHTQEEQLHAADQADGREQRRPAGYRIIAEHIGEYLQQPTENAQSS